MTRSEEKKLAAAQFEERCISLLLASYAIEGAGGWLGTYRDAGASAAEAAALLARFDEIWSKVEAARQKFLEEQSTWATTTD